MKLELITLKTMKSWADIEPQFLWKCSKTTLKLFEKSVSKFHLKYYKNAGELSSNGHSNKQNTIIE